MARHNRTLVLGLTPKEHRIVPQGDATSTRTFAFGGAASLASRLPISVFAWANLAIFFFFFFFFLSSLVQLRIAA